MYTDIEPSASLAVLFFLGTIGVSALVALACIFAFWKNQPYKWKFMLATCAIPVLYLCLLLTFSLISHEKNLEKGKEKHICEIDCHLAYSVLDVQQRASGDYQIVLRARFDRDTISPNRGDGPLTPNPRTIIVVDDQGNQISVTPPESMYRPLRPGQAILIALAVHLPTSSHGRLKLLVTPRISDTWFLIGHENSPFHKKAYFLL